MRAHFQRCAVIVLLAAAGTITFRGTSPAQVPTDALGDPDVVMPGAFSMVRGARELPSGQLLVADWIEERVVVVDLDSGQVTERMDPGAGPGEVRLPAALIPLPGDSTLVVDQGNARLTVLDPHGTPARTIRAMRPGQLAIGGADDRGHLYYAIPPWARNAQALQGDSVMLARWNPTTDEVESLGPILGSRRPSNRQPSREMRIPVVGYAPRDDFVATPDGGLVVVRAGDYHLELWREDSVVRGPSIPSQPRPVTEEDRRALILGFLAGSPMSGRGEGGGLGHTPSSARSDAQVERLLRSTEFADTHPPFRPGGVVAGPDRTTWVERSTAAGDGRAYDVFDHRGHRVRQVRLPPGRELVAIGAKGIYAVVENDMGLQGLERYPRS